MRNLKTRTVVFITGSFVSHTGWDDWRSYFESAGFVTLAPPWLLKEGSAEELRNRQPNDVVLASLRLEELLDHYAAIIQSLPEKPIVIGHSLGG